MPHLFGYEVLEELSLTQATRVVRALAIAGDEPPVILKLPADPFPRQEQIARIEHEATVLQKLSGAGSPRLRHVLREGAGLALALDDSGSLSLDRHLATDGNGSTMRALPVEQFLPLAISIAKALDAVHGAGIVHKDINPANIIVRDAAGSDERAFPTVHIIDFGIASNIGPEHVNATRPDALEGSLKYISPEQTGRINRMIDHRTDFYSLGITYYELLAGRAPFDATDALALVHCHIARTPPSLTSIDERIPEAVAQIVEKLMAKSPDARYRSARGIVADLEECLDQLRSTGRIQPFALGSDDVNDRFLIPQKLYGRDDELAALDGLFEATRGGGFQTMLVTGDPGIGKSSLLDEFRPTTILLGAHFVSGKFDQYGNNPYSAFIAAMRQLIRSALGGTADEIGHWRERLHKSLGQNGAIMTELLPELELVIGTQVKALEVSPNEVQKRFQTVFHSFIQALTTKDHPIVLFLDDLQWIDSASARLYEEILESNGDGRASKPLAHVLLIGSYRPKEGAPSTAFGPFLDAMRTIRSKGILRIPELNVGPLGLADTTQLIAETLDSSHERATPLAETVLAKTGGNPYFIAEVLRYLYREDILRYEADKRRWAWDLNAIRQLEVTENVASLMRENVRRLPNETQEILQAAAAIGPTFSLSVLSELISGSSKQADLSEVTRLLKPAADEGLVFPLSESSTADQSGPRVAVRDRWYKFAHDRVQEAAYEALGENEPPKWLQSSPTGDRTPSIDDGSSTTVDARAALHLAIGHTLERIHERTLERSSGVGENQSSPPVRGDRPSEDNPGRLFEILRHLNLARDLVRDPHERLRLASMNLEAAERARASAAFDVASSYYVFARELYPGDPWIEHGEFAIRAMLGYAESLYPNGHWAECDRLFEEMLAHAKPGIEAARVRARQVEYLLFASRIDQALEAALAGLQTLGVTIPRRPSKLAVARSILETKWRLRSAMKGKNYDDLLGYRRTTDERHQLVLRICSTLIAAAYMESEEFFGAIITKMVNYSLKYGFTAESALGFTLYGGVLSMGLGDSEGGLNAGRMGIKLAASLHNAFFQGRCEFLVATLLSHWREPVEKNLEILAAGHRRSVESGDTQYASQTQTQLCVVHLYRGAHVESISEAAARGADLTGAIQYADMALYFSATRLLIRGLVEPAQVSDGGITANAFNDPVFLEQIGTSTFHAARMYYFYIRLLLAIVMNETDEAIRTLAGCASIRHGLKGQAIFADCLALNVLAVCDAGRDPKLRTATSTREAKKLVQSAAGKFKKWSANAPENFESRHMVIRAEGARLNGKEQEAIQHYRQAVQKVIEEKNLLWSGLLQERLARMLRADDPESATANRQLKATPEAALFLQESYRAYRAWGAKTKLDQLSKEFEPDTPGLFGESARRSSGTRTQNMTVTGDSAHLDFESILKSSQVLASEIQLAPLLERMMSIVVENAGAERGALILKRTGADESEPEWTLSAEYVLETGRCSLEVHPLEAAASVPIRIIEYSIRTREEILLHDAEHDARFGADPWVQHHHSKSILCVPIQYQGTLTAILYLENSLSSGVFTERRVELLRLLAGQISSSLNNALLYENLEERVRERTEEIERQKREVERQKEAAEIAMEKSEALLLNILPAETAQELKETGKAKARSFEEATVLFADVQNFTTIARPLRPEELVAELDACFGAFDRIITKHSVEKIKTVGDAYLCVGGVPVSHGDDALRTVRAALEMQTFAEKRRAERATAGLFSFAFRLGIHTGPVTAGIVGSKKFAYDIWGDTVNTAARMQTAGEIGKVNLSRSTYERVCNDVRCEARGKFKVKNAGELEMYFAVDDRSSTLAE